MRKQNRFLSLILVMALVVSLVGPLVVPVHAANKVYYPIDYTEEVLASRVVQQVSGGCAVASMATIEAYMYGATTEADKKTVYDALVAANGDDNYAYWRNVGYITSQDSIDWEAVYTQISQGTPCIIHRPASGSQSQHWSVVAGYQGSTTKLEPDKFLVVEVNEQSGAAIQTVAQWRGSTTVDRYTWRGSGMALTQLPGIHFAINHPPVVKEYGVAHQVYGHIASDSALTQVEISVTNLGTGEFVFHKYLTPNAGSYDLSALDSSMSYSSWAEGTYYYTVYASNAAGAEMLDIFYFEIVSAYPQELPDPAYTFSFDANGGKGTMNSFSLHLGDSLALPACTLTRNDSELGGWYARRNDETWYTTADLWLTEEEIAAEGYDKYLFGDGFTGVLDDWWLWGALALPEFTFVAQWPDASEDTEPTEPEPTEPEPTEPEPTEPEPTEPEPTEPEPTEPEPTEPEPTEPEPTEPEPTEPEPTEPEPTEPEPTDPPKPNVSITRLSGSGRCETAIEIADMMKEAVGIEKFDAIIIANGDNFADALAGSYLATQKNAPILLYRASAVEMNLEYIRKNLAADGIVYLLGGDSAVPTDVADGLQNAGIHVQRLAGSSRFDTNLEILKEAGIEAGQEILVATGYNFADSLSASATGLPILMVNNGLGELTDAQVAFLDNLEGCTFTVIGGDSAVSSALMDAIGAYGDVTRLSGKNREATSVLVAETYFDSPKRILLAYSRNFPDGLCGGPLAYALGAPLILTNAGQEAVAAAYVAENGITKGLVLGGKSVVSDATVNAVFRQS